MMVLLTVTQAHVSLLKQQVILATVADVEEVLPSMDLVAIEHVQNNPVEAEVLEGIHLQTQQTYQLAAAEGLVIVELLSVVCEHLMEAVAAVPEADIAKTLVEVVEVWVYMVKVQMDPLVVPQIVNLLEEAVQEEIQVQAQQEVIMVEGAPTLAIQAPALLE
jgi:hypothetical protein